MQGLLLSQLRAPVFDGKVLHSQRDKGMVRAMPIEALAIFKHVRIRLSHTSLVEDEDADR